MGSVENSGKGDGKMLKSVNRRRGRSGSDFMIDFRELPFHEDDLNELLKLNIDFVFQPIFDSVNLSLSGYEALMRPVGKSPLELIEEYAKMDKLFVIELATCFGATMAYKKRGYTEDLCINSFPSEYMNEGQSQLYHECFPELVGKIVVEMVEYTELNKSKWSEKRADIEKHHTRVALDDFATGNNDSVAVDYFKPEYVKLDRSLITDIQLSEDKQKEVERLVKIFHEKGIKVIAEGIENEGEIDYLRKHTEVDFLQGYYLAMPK